MAPIAAVILPLFIGFTFLHLINTIWGLIVAYLSFNLPFAIWIMNAFFADLPPGIEEAARVDGATSFQTFWRVALPLTAPGIVTTAILCLVFSWNDYAFAVTFAGPGSQTLPVAASQLITQTGVGLGPAHGDRHGGRAPDGARRPRRQTLPGKGIDPGRRYGRVRVALERNPMQNKAAVMHGTHDVRLEDVPVPEPGPNEVLVEIRAVGVCGSDVHYYEEGRIGSFVVEEPLILGHESMGTVVALGENATRHEVGDRVTLEPGVPDGTCRECRAGRYNLCPNVRFFATPPIDGAFTNFVSINEDFAFALPDSLSDNAGALMEPLSVGIWACKKAGVTAGDHVLITGAGPIGLVAMQVAFAQGATEVTLTDVANERLRDRKPSRRDAHPERGRGATGGERHRGGRPDRMFRQRACPGRRHPARQAGRRRRRCRDGPERGDERAPFVHPDQ